MIVIALCAVLVVAIATLAIGTHLSRRQPPAAFRQPPETASAAAAYFRDLGDAPPTPHPAAWEPVMAAPTASQPPWDWAGGVQPDPETLALVTLAEAPYTRLAGRPGTAWPDAIWITEEEPCASGNGHVTVAEPLAPLPPEPKPEPHPAPATPTGTTEAGTRPGDALTLLDERQQLIDHAAAVIAAAKFDRILGAVMADA